MADDALSAIRAVSEKALRDISPPVVKAAIAGDPQDDLLLAALAARVDPGGVDLSGARLRNTRRVLLKLVRPATESQWAFNADVERALSRTLAAIRAQKVDLDVVRAGLCSAEILADNTDARVGELEDAINGMSTRSEIESAERRHISEIESAERRHISEIESAERRHIAAVNELRGILDQQASKFDQVSNQQADRLDALASSVEKLAAAVERSQGELARHRAVVDLALRELRSSLPTDGPDLEAVTRPLDESYDRFYDDFESVFRGTREQVMERQREYLALVADIPGPVLDIGPGRGEWLELLRDAGISASGVDTNSEFVAGCTDRGLDVIHADAFDHLRKVPESSLGAITAFQVVEHLPFEVLVDLLGLCLVALRPGGVLILETPNPSNLKVGAMTFWNDPSHVHPLPPHMLEFLVKWRGFVDAKVHFPERAATQSLEIAGVDSGALDDINWAMFGPLDYAIVARRP